MRMHGPEYDTVIVGKVENNTMILGLLGRLITIL
jgi:hypothetical protein